MKIRICIGNPFPGDGDTEILSIISLWEEVDTYFKNEYKEQKSLFGIDISDLVATLRSGAECFTDASSFRRKFYRQQNNGFWCHVDIHYRKTNFPGDKPPILEACYFLQNLFVAMNLCMRGGCHFYSCLPIMPDLRAYHLSLNGHPLESGWCVAAAWGWPNLRRLSFRKVWSWLQRVGVLNADIAKSPAQVGAFSMLEIASQNFIEPKDIILVSQTLETLFVGEHDGISSRLRKRVKLVLGEPITNKNWLTKLYALRSKIVHGSYPVVRPVLGHMPVGSRKRT